MRSAGCIINDLLDRDIDIKVQRTQTRPLYLILYYKKSIICLIILWYWLIVLTQLNLPSIILALVIVPWFFYIHWPKDIFYPIYFSFYL